MQKTRATEVYKRKKMKATSSSDVDWRIEDTVWGSVITRNPFSFTLVGDPSDSNDTPDVDR